MLYLTAGGAACTRWRVLASSPLALPAEWMMICIPFTAASIPSSLAKSPVANSMPSVAS